MRCSFATIPNAFKQCTISLLITHSALFKGVKEKRSDPSFILMLITLFHDNLLPRVIQRTKDTGCNRVLTIKILVKKH
jgi:hypothetical protein